MTSSDSDQNTKKVIKDQTIDHDGESVWTSIAIQGACVYWNQVAVEKFWQNDSAANTADIKSSIVSLRPMWRA